MSLAQIAQALSAAVSPLQFSAPVTHVYNPLDYAWRCHERYLERYGKGPKEAVFMGMNPGPWGMAQSGIPFGEVNHVRDWLRIDEPVEKPIPEHPKRPVLGLDCPRTEVSGDRIWTWAKQRFQSADAFFERFFVVNYCPLSFMEESGRNRTPDKLPASEREPLFEACDTALRQTIEVLQPQIVIGVGKFAEDRARIALKGMDVPIGRILHPSPASPLANRGWAERATAELQAMGFEF
jgi:single-strand selective monofunctional uracil DNA glycosylase